MTDAERQEKYAELIKKATDYANNKSVESSLKKKIDSDNTSIKALMEMLQTTEVQTTDGATVCYSITKRESIDEEKLIVNLRKYAPDTRCIKIKEVVDMDILEDEIYHGKLSDKVMSALNNCRIVKEIPTLTIKKTKKGK